MEFRIYFKKIFGNARARTRRAGIPALSAGVASLWQRLRNGQIPIAYKLAMVVSVLIITGMATLGSVIINNQRQLLSQQIEDFGRTVVNQVADSSKELLLADDRLGLSVLVNNLISDNNIIGTSIFTAKHKVIARSGLTPMLQKIPFREIDPEHPVRKVRSFQWESADFTDTGNIVSFVTTIRFKDIIAGYAVVSFSSHGMEQAIRDSVRAITVATVLMTLIAVFFSFLMGRRITRPIHHLIAASRAIGEGRYNIRIDERRNDEIGYLMESINDMAEGLLRKNQVEHAFSRYMSPKIAKQILKDIDSVELGGLHVTGSVLFADIVGYTEMSGRMSPGETVQLLNEYFPCIGKACEFYNGTIDKFMGDCAMVVFGIPEYDEEDSFHAIACALLIQRLVEELNTKRELNGLFPIHFRFGVNTGEMLAGNMGTQDRMEYTVVGDSVNLASRLCSFAEAGEIVITGELYSFPEIRDRVIAHKHHSIKLRSRPTPVSTYVVSDLVPRYRAIMSRQIEAILSGKAVA